MGQNCCKEHYVAEDFLLISIPEQRMNSSFGILSKSGAVSSASLFPLPELKVGTLDALFSINDELIILEKNTESILKAMLGAESNFEKVQLQNALEMKNLAMRFRWDDNKYSSKLPIKDIVAIITKQLLRADNDFRKLCASLQDVRSNLKQVEVKDTDSLATKDVNEILNPNDFILDSSHFQVIPVLVPKTERQRFLEQYTSLASMVVPDSAVILIEDKQHCLFKVTMFKTVIEEFKKKAAENKYMVKDYDHTTKPDKEDRRDQLTKEEDKVQSQFLRWLPVNFREVFQAYLHLKALRIFVESVLKYGVPVNFKAAIVEPRRGTERRVKNQLISMFSDLDADSGPIEHGGDAGIMATIKTHKLEEYYKFVLLSLTTNFNN